MTSFISSLYWFQSRIFSLDITYLDVFFIKIYRIISIWIIRKSQLNKNSNDWIWLMTVFQTSSTCKKTLYRHHKKFHHQSRRPEATSSKSHKTTKSSSSVGQSDETSRKTSQKKPQPTSTKSESESSSTTHASSSPYLLLAALTQSTASQVPDKRIMPKG